MPTPRRKSPRRRAKQQRARETVETVVEAAARVLVREGYARATTNRIAEAAGVSVGSVYQYFADKDEIFDALLRRETGRALEAVLAVAADPATPLEDVLRRMLGASLRSHRYGTRIYRQLAQLPGDRFRQRIGEANLRLLAHVRAFLEQHRSRLRVADLDTASFVVVHASEGLGFNAPPDLQDEALLEETTALLCRYLLRLPGERPAPRRRAGPEVPSTRSRGSPSGRGRA